MRLRLRPFVVAAALLLILAGALGSAAQVNETPPEIKLLNEINRLRRLENLPPLVLNDQLEAAAVILLDDLLPRDLTTRGDTLQLRDGTTAEQLLERNGYRAYSDGYNVDVSSLILRDFGPENVITYWRENVASDSSLQSRLMIRGTLSFLPMFYGRFREVGIGYTFNEENARHYYTFIFAGQPDVLPVVITELTSNDRVEVVFTPDVLVHIHDEVARQFGDANATLARLQTVRISESLEEQACPQGNDLYGDWEFYRANFDWTFSEGFGTRTIYVQLCDLRGNTLTQTVQIDYLERDMLETPAPLGLDPRVFEAVQATQTAAVEATIGAQIAPTVEAILTATAAAPTPTPGS